MKQKYVVYQNVCVSEIAVLSTIKPSECQHLYSGPLSPWNEEDKNAQKQQEKKDTFWENGESAMCQMKWRKASSKPKPSQKQMTHPQCSPKTSPTIVSWPTSPPQSQTEIGYADPNTAETEQRKCFKQTVPSIDITRNSYGQAGGVDSSPSLLLLVFASHYGRC